MKHMKKILVLCMVMALCLSMMPSAFAASSAVIDRDRTGTLDVYKYDLTNAEADGVWNSSYVSTGVYDADGVNAILGDPTREVDLGNGEVSYGYALKGVEFTYLKVASIDTYSKWITDSDGKKVHETAVLYGIAPDDTAFLSAIGLTTADRYAPADGDSMYYYASDAIMSALDQALASNPTTVKNALEEVAVRNGGTPMAETDSYGHTSASELPLGLYLLVETRVPEMVTSTTNPFLISLPMTSVNGTNASNGGTEWLYDITVYPKNATGNPTLEKTVREDQEDTGKNNGSADILDGYEHTATLSSGDTADYQIISKLPTITSRASFLTDYTFTDTLSKGISYSKGDVVIEFFTDSACTESVTVWKQSDNHPRFEVTYESVEDGSEKMVISMTDAGLHEINTSSAVYSSDKVTTGYSDCYLRITYKAVLNSDASVVFGDSANPNEVILRWKRTNTNYFDTLRDDCHVYTYAMDLTKQFSDEDGNFANVEFILKNATDGYWVKADFNTDEGVYYVTDHMAEEADATHFIPTDDGSIVLKGMEDDEYTLTEVRTDDGYVLLKDPITVKINTEVGAVCDVCGKSLLTATASVDGAAVTMTEDNSSVNAIVPLTVINTHGFDLPPTGDNGALMFTIGGIAIAGIAVLGILCLLIPKRKKN